MVKPIVAIIGHPNVGKSTLFNYIGKRRLSIVDTIPGLTRDRLYMDGEWRGTEFTMIDTAGIQFKTKDTVTSQMHTQAMFAVKEAAVILFMVDGKFGITLDDKEIAKILRSNCKNSKPIILCVNKIDSLKQDNEVFEFYKLGLGYPIGISATNARNLGDLLDKIINSIPNIKIKEKESEDIIKLALVGRPNVGKSSLLNSLLGTQRAIVSSTPGTTRDAIDSYLEKDGQKYLLIDTAGMRRKSKIDFSIERYSIMRSLKAIERADIVVILIDAIDRLTEQDKKIAGYVHENGRGCIIGVNKWDLIKKNNQTIPTFQKEIYNKLVFMKYAPIVFLSAFTKKRISKVLELAKYVSQQHSMRIQTSILNQIFVEAQALYPPPNDKGRRLKIFYATQASIQPPTFIVFVNSPSIMHFSYLRYLENKLREAFSFDGTPIKLIIREHKERIS